MGRRSVANLIIFLFIIMFMPMLHAAESVVIDGDKIIEYKGFSGQWIVNSKPEILNNAIKTYSSGNSDVIAANGPDYRTQKAVFIPFSESYSAFVKNRAACRSMIQKDDEFIWPIANFDRISSSFGRRWRTFHEGIDIPAGRGIPILAVSGGRVTGNGYAGNLGYAVTVEHRNNMFTRYCHCSQVLVKEGEIVKKGQIIAYVGSSGNSTGNHLHFEVRFGDFPLNPLDFLPFSTCVKETQYLKKFDD